MKLLATLALSLLAAVPLWAVPPQAPPCRVNHQCPDQAPPVKRVCDCSVTGVCSCLPGQCECLNCPKHSPNAKAGWQWDTRRQVWWKYSSPGTTPSIVNNAPQIAPAPSPAFYQAPAFQPPPTPFFGGFSGGFGGGCPGGVCTGGT